MTTCPIRAVESSIYPGSQLEFVGAEISVGATSRIYKLRKGQGGEVYAGKLYSKSAMNEDALKATISREKAAMSCSDHPSILKLVEHITLDNYELLVTELCNGKNLAEIMRHSKIKKKCFQPRLAMEVLMDLLDGLIDLLKGGVIHRDIKPENIGTHNGKAKILDFNASTKQYPMTVIGTPVYQAPETFNMQEYDYKCDVWSLGVTLYMLLFGRDPWNSYSVFTDTSQEPTEPGRFGEDLPFPPDPKQHIPAELRSMIRQMITKEPDKRPTYEQIRSQTERILHQLNHPQS